MIRISKSLMKALNHGSNENDALIYLVEQVSQITTDMTKKGKTLSSRVRTCPITSLKIRFAIGPEYIDIYECRSLETRFKNRGEALEWLQREATRLLEVNLRLESI